MVNFGCCRKLLLDGEQVFLPGVALFAEAFEGFVVGTGTVADFHEIAVTFEQFCCLGLGLFQVVKLFLYGLVRVKTGDAFYGTQRGKLIVAGFPCRLCFGKF